MTKSPASKLASLRWKKEKPNPEYFKRISKLGVEKRWGKKKSEKTEKKSE